MLNVSARPSRSRVLAGALWLAGLSSLLFLGGALVPVAAQASHRQVSIMYEDQVSTAPGQTLQELRHLGAGTVRFVVHWSDIAPNPNSFTAPKFNAADPAAYPPANWSTLDAVVRTARADGVTVLLTVAGHVPLWVWGPGVPRDPRLRASLGAWKPSAPAFGQFMRALGTRYSGHYHGLPAIRDWEIYNEPGFGEDLAPQSVGPVRTGPDMYRSLLASAWGALRATGHRRDLILIGALSAHGQANPGLIGETRPLDFVRELYCLDSRYRPFRGRAATRRGCPSTPKALRRFRAQNGGLFNAGGFAIHPYPLGLDMTTPPNRTRFHDKNYAGFSQLPNLIKALDRSLRADGSRKRYSLWNDEYGYISNPPRGDGVSLANQATYLNWAEYLSYKNPRIASFMQYLLVDPDPTHGVVTCGGFASGLIFNPALTTAPCAHGALGGAPKPALDAWRLPLYLPRTTTRKGGQLEVWGCVRPAAYAIRDTHRPQVGHLQFQAAGSSTFTDLATVTFRNPNGSCYFDRRIRFSRSGTLRLAYSYPVDAALLPTFAVGYRDPLNPAVSRSIPIIAR